MTFRYREEIVEKNEKNLQIRVEKKFMTHKI